MSGITQNSLVDRKQLIEMFPALGGKKYRLDWLIRNRSIPLIKINRSVYFNPRAIDEWIKNNEINEVGKNG